MLHIHFGAGRLGLGLVAPFLKTKDTDLILLNRASSGKKPTGSTALDPLRRNDILQHRSTKEYLIDNPGPLPDPLLNPRERVQYDSYFPYRDGDIEGTIQTILDTSHGKAKAVVVTASVLDVKNYEPVVDALNVICRTKQAQPDAIGDVYLIACENMVNAAEVMQHSDLKNRIADQVHKHVRCVHALVDRVCAELEECQFEGEPTVLVRAEEYGSLKLQLCPETEALPELLKGSRAEFSRHLAVEKEIKSWLLNGAQWLIALTAFREANGDSEIKLNDFICSTDNHRQYAAEVIYEMRDGIEALLNKDPLYASFIRDVDAKAYLDGAAASILKRFQQNEDSIRRILARFRAPSADEYTTVQSFVDRFLHRIEPPMLAYQMEKGVPPKSSTQGVFNLFRLQASGTYVDTAHPHERQAA